MTINSEKFELIRYGNNKILQENTYTAGEDRHYWREEHVHRSTQTANQMCSWILGTFLSRYPKHFLMLWKSLVVSKRECVCQLWSLYRMKDIQELEQVQRVFTRKITVESLTYWDRLNIQGMYSWRAWYLAHLTKGKILSRAKLIPGSAGNATGKLSLQCRKD